MREQNLRALESRDGDLARRIRDAAPDPRIIVHPSRAAGPVPCLEGPDRPIPLHSLVDPVREGERMADTLRGAGYVVTLGLGGGFHIRPLLDRPEVAFVLVIEKDTSTLSALIEGSDLRTVLSHARVTVMTAEDPARIESMILATYSPLVAGGLHMIALRPWCERERPCFDSAADAVRGAAEAAGADLATQAHFGKRWFTNILANLPRAEQSGFSPAARATALVTAAGPSLEAQMPEIADRRAGALLVATDTSLPALRAGGISPDVVLSIDCQIYSYHHFLGGMPQGATVLLDLASPALLARNFPRHAFFASAHPFCQLLSRRWRQLASVDTSGGNVTHAAVSLARRLGAATIRLYGADFSCPGGKPHARGTYLFDVFGCRAGRRGPLETLLYASLFRAGDPLRDWFAGSLRYTTPLLLSYRRNLQRLCAGMDAEVVAVPGDGLDLGLAGGGGNTPRRHAGRTGSGFSPVEEWPAGHVRCGWEEFLREYSHGVRALPPAHPPLASWFAGLGDEAKELWGTILPVAATVLRESNAAARASAGSAGVGSIVCPEAAALEGARAWVLERLSRALSKQDARVPHE